MATTKGESLMGRLQFQNQDGEWESFPTEDEIHRSKEVIAILEELLEFYKELEMYEKCAIIFKYYQLFLKE